jgi:signal transduction histidine kinase
VTALWSRSIAGRLTRMNMLVSGAALLLACTSFIAYDLISFRDTIVGNLRVQASIIGANSVSALMFDDQHSAETTLSALSAAPDIVSAGLYGSDGRLFAAYTRGGLTTPPPARLPARSDTQLSWFDDPGIRVVRPVAFQATQPGVVYLRSDLDAVHRRLQRFAVIVLAVLLSSLFAALFISRLARRSIAQPMIDLAKVASRVSQERDYSVRATAVGTTHEVELLVTAFNTMLAQIQSNDRELHASRDQLEARVHERTAELTALNQELEAFSYSVSHDLRAPLRHVSGFVSMLESHAAQTLDDKGRRYLATIATAAARMGRLIDDLLAFSRMGRAQLTKSATSLDALVKEARAEVIPAAAGRRVEWTIHPLPDVAADPAMLKLAIVNLLSNAIKYTGTRPCAQIEVGTAAGSPGEVVLFVRDNGVGFEMQYVHKLFGVFQRLHRSDEFEGTGIGLANVRRIITRHGGRVWAESAIDHGATFYVTLPTHQG